LFFLASLTSRDAEWIKVLDFINHTQSEGLTPHYTVSDTSHTLQHLIRNYRTSRQTSNARTLPSSNSNILNHNLKVTNHVERNDSEETFLETQNDAIYAREITFSDLGESTVDENNEYSHHQTPIRQDHYREVGDSLHFVSVAILGCLMLEVSGKVIRYDIFSVHQMPGF